MSSDIDICNRALLSIGSRDQVSSINPSDGSTSADACAVLYTPTFESLARSAHWSCLRNQVTLSLLKAAAGTPENPLGTTLSIPPSPWLYSYAYPADCLKVRSLIPTFLSSTGITPDTTFNNTAPIAISESGQIIYAVAYDVDNTGSPIKVILTNLTQAQCIYTVNQPNPIIWDSQLQAAMVASLAAFLVPALSLNLQLMTTAIKLADGIIAQARVSDGNEGVTVMDHTPDWIRARGANACLIPNGFFGYSQYESMPWPAG